MISSSATVINNVSVAVGSKILCVEMMRRLAEMGFRVRLPKQNHTRPWFILRMPLWDMPVHCRLVSVKRSCDDCIADAMYWQIEGHSGGVVVVDTSDGILVHRHLGRREYKIIMSKGWQDRAVGRGDYMLVSSLDGAAECVVSLARKRRVRLVKCSHCGFTTKVEALFDRMGTDDLLEAAQLQRMKCMICEKAGADEGHLACAGLEVEGRLLMDFHCSEPPKRPVAKKMALYLFGSGSETTASA